jgi:hypothetical protein
MLLIIKIIYGNNPNKSELIFFEKYYLFKKNVLNYIITRYYFANRWIFYRISHRCTIYMGNDLYLHHLIF